MCFINKVLQGVDDNNLLDLDERCE